MDQIIQREKQSPGTPRGVGVETDGATALARRRVHVDYPAPHAAIKLRLGPWARELADSGIDPRVAIERGYTVAHEPERLVRLGFGPGQRRAPAMVVPMYSPDGETVAYQIKPDNPRPGIKYKTPTGSRIIVDVHPRMVDAVLDRSVPLWITEGIKKADALTSQGLPTVGLIGVWNFAVPGTRCEELLPCWDHVPLADRTVYVVYDADARTNANVQRRVTRMRDASSES